MRTIGYFFKSFLRNVALKMGYMRVECTDLIGAYFDFTGNTHSTQFQKCRRTTHIRVCSVHRNVCENNNSIAWKYQQKMVALWKKQREGNIHITKPASYWTVLFQLVGFLFWMVHTNTNTHAGTKMPATLIFLRVDADHLIVFAVVGFHLA